MKKLALVFVFGLSLLAMPAIASSTPEATAKAAHPKAEHNKKDHKHGKKCGHKAVKHGDHTDYEHDGHAHKSHGDHYDECESPAGHDAKKEDKKSKS